MNEAKIKLEILSTLNHLNESWTIRSDVGELEKYFHDNIVVFEPGRRELRKGKKECIEGWKSFIETFKINYWKESGHLVQIYNEGRMAVVTYYWEISTEGKGKNFISKGRDMFIFIKENER